MGTMCKGAMDNAANYANRNKPQGIIKEKLFKKVAQNIEVQDAQKFKFIYDVTHVSGKKYGYSEAEQTVQKVQREYGQFVPTMELGKSRTYFSFQIMSIHNDIYFGIQLESNKDKKTFHGQKNTVYYNCYTGGIYVSGTSHTQDHKTKCQNGDIITIIVDLQNLKIQWRKNGIPVMDPMTLPMLFREEKVYLGVEMYNPPDKVRIL